MKGVFILALGFVMMFFVTTSYATTHYVTITDTAIVPDNFTANVGDTVVWSFSESNVYQNNTSSDTIPFGAAPWGSPPEEPGGPDFTYVITVPGTYHYQSTYYNPLTASFIVAPVAHHIIITDTAFLPDSFSASIGDTVIWQAASGNLYSNNTASTTLPAYAAAWSSGPLSPGQTYTYVIGAAGVYNYESTTHNTFTADFNVIGNLTHYVIITDTGFIPADLIANVGDTIVWIAAKSNQHDNNTTPDTTLGSIPYYANYWDSYSLAPGDSFSYVIEWPGTYTYESDSITDTLAIAFYGTISVGTGVVTTGISNLASPVAANLIFQNPFTDQLDIKSDQPGELTIYNILGERVAYTEMEFTDHPVQINMAGYGPGIYLIAYTRNGILVRTYKAVKVN